MSSHTSVSKTVCANAEHFNEECEIFDVSLGDLENNTP